MSTPDPLADETGKLVASLALEKANNIITGTLMLCIAGTILNILLTATVLLVVIFT